MPLPSVTAGSSVTREVGGGHLLDRPDDELRARVGLAHGVGARLAPGRDHAGAAELRVGLDRDRDELVGEDAAAEDRRRCGGGSRWSRSTARARRSPARARRRRRPRRRRRDPGGNGRPGRARFRPRWRAAAGRSRSRRRRRRRGAARTRERPAGPRELRADDAGPCGDQPRGGGAGEQVAAAGGERAQDRRVVRAVLGVGVAGEADAGAAADARRAPAVGHRVDQQRHRRRSPARAPRRRARAPAARRWRRTAASGSRGGARRRTGAARPRRRRPAPTRRGRSTARGPRSRSASPRTARRRSSAMRKSSGQNRHAWRAVDARSAADGHRVVVPGRLGGRDGCVADEPRVAGRRRIDLALESGQHARVAQVIARQVVAAQRLAALDEQDPPARLGEHARGHPAARSGADHDDVVLVRQVVGRDRRRCRLRLGRPARARLHGPVAEPRPRARISVVGAGRDLQDPGDGDPGRRAGIGEQLAHQRFAIGPAPGGEVGRADDRRQRRHERPVVLDRDAGHERVGDGSQQVCRCVMQPGHVLPAAHSRAGGGR